MHKGRIKKNKDRLHNIYKKYSIAELITEFMILKRSIRKTLKLVPVRRTKQ